MTALVVILNDGADVVVDLGINGASGWRQCVSSDQCLGNGVHLALELLQVLNELPQSWVVPAEDISELAMECLNSIVCARCTIQHALVLIPQDRREPVSVHLMYFAVLTCHPAHE